MKMKKITAALCAAVMAIGMSGVPAVGNVFGVEAAIEASAADTDLFDYKTLDDGTLKITNYKGTSAVVVIPEKSETYGKTISQIGDSAFKNNTSITKVVIPNSVTTIGLWAFEGCKSLKEVTIPDSLLRVSGDSFKDCTSLKSLDLTNTGITSISGICDGCSSLESFKLPKALVSFDTDNIRNCVSLKYLFIPDTVEYISRGVNTWWFGSEKIDLTVECFNPSAGYDWAIDQNYKIKIHEHRDIIHKVVTQPTCTERGYQENYCGICGKKLPGTTGWDYIPATGHKYTTTVVKPTTTSQGYTLHKCSVCGDSYKDNYTEKLKPVSTKTDISTVPAKLNATKIAYTGKAKTPGVKMTVGGKKLIKGTDFTVTYSNNIKPGKATAKITGIGNYTGTQTLVFYIVPKKTKLDSVTSPAKTKLTVNWKRDTLADGYQLQVSTAKGFKPLKKALVIKKNSTVKSTVSGLKSGTTYFVRVRAFKKVGNTRRFGAYSTPKTVQVK